MGVNIYLKIISLSWYIEKKYPVTFLSKIKKTKKKTRKTKQ